MAADDKSLLPSVGAVLPPHPLDNEWYVLLDSDTAGPFTGHRIKHLIQEGRVDAETNVVRKGASEWTDAIDDRALAPLFKRQSPPVAAPSRQQPPVNAVAAAPGATVVQVTNNLADDRRAVILEEGRAEPKSAGVALILSILIVGLGQLYNGQVGKGILMFFLCIALWFVLLGWIINIWSWVDAYQTASRMNERYYRRVASGIIR